MSPKHNFQESVKEFYKLLVILFIGLIVCIGLLLYTINNPKNDTSVDVTNTTEYVEVPEIEEDYDKIENGIHVRTGFVDGEGLMLVVQNCTNCHSAKLVTQNRMSKEKWLATIRWMQKTQNLWDLGTNEEPILNYLSTYYAPNQIGRRENLKDIEWYELEN